MQTLPREIILNVAFPKIARLENREGAEVVIKKAKYFVFVSTLICGFLAIIIPFVIPFLYTTSYSDVIFYAQLMLIAEVAGSPGSLFNQTLKAQGRASELFKLTTITNIIEIALFFVMIPLFGLLGGVFVRIMYNLSLSIMSYVLLKNPK